MTSARVTIARDLERIGGPRALSTPVIAVTVLVMMTFTVVLDAFGQRGPTAQWALAGIGSLAITLAFLLIARATVLPVRPRPSRPVITLLVFAVAGAIRYVSLTLLAHSLGLPLSTNRSALTAAAMTALLMSLTVLIVCRIDEHRQTLQQLTEERRRLLALGATFEERVAQSERALTQQVHAQLDPALEEIETLLSSDSGDDASPAVEVLSNAVSEIVRPMSHRLGAAPSAASATLEEAIYDPDELITSERRADIRDALHPGATAVLCGLITLSYLPRLTFPLGKMLAVITLVILIIWATGTAARLLWPARVRMQMTLPALLVLLGINAAIGVVVTRLSRLLLSAGFLSPVSDIQLVPQAQGPVWAGLAALVIGFALSALTLAQRRLEDVEQDLREVNTRLAIAVAQLRGQLWLNRRNLSWVLHGPVQSALVSAALEMNNPDLGAEDRSRIRQRIRQAIDTIDSASKREARVEHALAEIASVWELSCQINNHVAPDAAAELGDDPTATMAVIEVVREGVGNAVRHGGADTVDVSVDLESDAMVRVTVRDNGTGLAPETVNGLGTSMLDEVAYQWRRENSHPGTLLEVDVPLQG